MKLEQIAQIQIAEYYLPAIFNNDETGMTDEESDQLNAFLYPRFESCTFEVIDENPFLGHDEVSRLAGSVVRVNVYKTPAALNLYAVEFTDTFGGEANYCWVERFVVRAADIKKAITKAKKHRYYSPIPRHTLSDYGDMARIDIKGACVCAFINWLDPEEYCQDKHGEIVN